MGGKVFVRPVPDGVEDEELTAIFDRFGPIAFMHIHTLKADMEPLVRHAYIVRPIEARATSYGMRRPI